MAINPEQFPAQIIPPPLPTKEEIVAENIRRRAGRIKTSAEGISPIENKDGEQNDAEYMDALRSDITRLQILFESEKQEDYLRAKAAVLNGIFRRQKLKPKNSDDLQDIINSIIANEVLDMSGTNDINEANNIRRELLGPTEKEFNQAIQEVQKSVAKRLPPEKQALLDEARSFEVKFDALPDYNEGNRPRARSFLLANIEEQMKKFDLENDLKNPKLAVAFEKFDELRRDLIREELREKLLNITKIERKP